MIQAVCTKHRYDDKKAAQSAFNRCFSIRGRRGRAENLRIYHCFVCDGWHMTKESLQDFQAREEFHSSAPKLNRSQERKQTVTRALKDFPWCGFCGCELIVVPRNGTTDHKPEKNEAHRQRFYRNIPVEARKHLWGNCTSVIVCTECLRALNHLYQARHIQVLRERDGVPIAGGQ